ncbi:hypothetical protein N2152v2_001439 [Parachlorella kessleri]
MAARLTQAARRVSQQQLRGLANVLTEGSQHTTLSSSSSSLGQQPTAAVALRAFNSGTVGVGLRPAALNLAEAGTSVSAGQQQQEQPALPQQQQQQPAVPLGATDFARKELVMVFTCGKCDTRAAKAFSKASYERGVVVVDCPGCHSKHLIADNLGWFGQKGTVEEFAAEKGNLVVRKLADGTTTLTPEDILGPTVLQQGCDAATAGEGTAAAAAGGAG